MKKVMLAAAAVMVLGLVGCSKKVDCKCTTTMDGQVMQTVTMNDVEGGCGDLEMTQTIGGSTQVIKCEEI